MLPFPLLSCYIPCNSFPLPYQLLFQPVKVPFFLLVVFYIFPCGVCWEHTISSSEIHSSAPIQHLGTPCLVLSTRDTWAVSASSTLPGLRTRQPSIPCLWIPSDQVAGDICACCLLAWFFLKPRHGLGSTGSSCGGV